MARSKKRKQKMSQKRLDSINNIKQPNSKNSSHTPNKSSTPLSRPTDYAASPIEIHNARSIGLSVSSDTTAAQLNRQLAEFNLAKTYVQDVFTKITNQPYTQTDIDEIHFNRFVANLLAHGRIATKIAKTQQKRNNKNNPPISKNSTYRTVKNHLYAQFQNNLPKQSFLSKLLG